MPFVPVPKDLSKVKTKIALNLTKRQLICFSCAGAIGIPTYIFTRNVIGNEGSVLLMIAVMMPFFFIAMYEKDGQPAEKILRNYIRCRFICPSIRPYKTENFYRHLEKMDTTSDDTSRKEVKSIGNNKQTNAGTGKKTVRGKVQSKKT